MQLVLSSSVVGGNCRILDDGCFAEACLDTNFVAGLSVAVAVFVLVVLRVELAAFVGGIEV